MTRLRMWTVAIAVFATAMVAATLLAVAVEWPPFVEDLLIFLAFAAGLAGSYAAGCRIDGTTPELPPSALLMLVLIVGSLASVADWLVPDTARTLLSVVVLTWVVAIALRADRQRTRGERGVPGFVRITTSVDGAGGAACVHDVPVATVVAMVAQGWTTDEIVQQYPQLDADDVGECLHYAAATVAGQTPMPRTQSRLTHHDV